MSYNVKKKKSFTIKRYSNKSHIELLYNENFVILWGSNFPYTFDVRKRAIGATNHY